MKSTDIQEKQLKDLMRMVYEASGINLHEGKKELLRAKIAKRMRTTGISSTKTYLTRLHEDSNEFLQFIDTVTTNHTFFFRENKGCEFLVKKFSEPSNAGSSVNIWSAASSTGDEPYSVAVQMLAAGCNFKMTATDLSHTVLEFAQRGIYPMDRTRNVPSDILHKYFQKGHGKNKGYVKIKKEVRDKIKFEKFNLIKTPLPGEMFDIIFCRNVMIYFDEKTTELVVNRLCKVLKPGGFFVIGQAESLMGISHYLKNIKGVASTYVK